MPDAQRPSEVTGAEKESRLIRRIAFFAFLLNLLLAVVKGILTTVTNSVAVAASVVDSVVDSVASLAVFAGVLLSTKKTRRFPLGLYKIENLISVTVAIFIFIAGYEIGKTIVLDTDGASPVTSRPVVIVLAAAAATIFVFGRIAASVGRRTGSPALRAEGKHRQIDAISSFVVLVSALFAYLDVQISVFGISMDRIAAGVVLIFIVRAGIELLSDGMRVLLDASLDKETLSKVREIVNTEHAVSEILSLYGRNAGRYLFIQVTVTLRVTDLNKAHQIVTGIETNIRKEIPRVERVIIHYEPAVRSIQRAAVPLEKDGRTISRHLGDAPVFAFLILNTGKKTVEMDGSRINPHAGDADRKGIATVEWLIAEKIDLLFVPEVLKGRGPAYALSDAGVIVKTTENRSLAELIESLSNM